MTYQRRRTPRRSLFAGASSAEIFCGAISWMRNISAALRIRVFVGLSLSVAVLSGLTGCSKDSAKADPQTPLIAVVITVAAPETLMVGGSIQVAATVTNDVANAGVDWVSTCGNPTKCGTFSPAHTASGEPTMYTAPLAVPPKKNVAITALSTTDHSKSSVSTVALFSGVTAINLYQPPPTTLPAGSQILLGADVVGDPFNLGVDWVVTCPNPANPLNPMVTCSPALHSAQGGTVAFIIPANFMMQNLIGSTLTVTGAPTADPNVTTTFTILVTAGVGITITQGPPATLPTSGTAQLIAVVSNDTTNLGVTWLAQCQSFDCGTITPIQTASGAAATYTAPASLQSPVPAGGFPVMITAFSTAAGQSIASSAIVNIIAPVAVQITQPIVNSTISLNASASLVATVSNDDTANAGVDWTASCGSAGACGTFAPAHTASGGATIFTAPSAIPAGGTVTITAASTTDPTKTAQQTVTVTAAPPPNTLLTGRLIVLLTAKNSLNGPFVMGGQIVGDGNGNITTGSFDLADTSGNASPSTLFNVITPSSYSIGADGRGQIQLTLNTGALNGSFGIHGTGQSSTITLSVAFATTGHALLTETDGFGDATGTMDLQNPGDLAAFQTGAAGLNGTYSLQLSGVQNVSGFPSDLIAAALSAQANGTSVTITGTVADQSVNGAISSAPFAAASQSLFGAPTQNGEILLSAINLGLPTAYNLDLWLIDANHYVVTDWQDGILGGYLTVQPATPSVSGAYAFTSSGATAAAQTQVAGGIFNCGAAGTLDVVPLGGAALSAQAITATCATPANGRSVIAFTGSAVAGISQFAAYPTLDRGTYLLELDGGASGTAGSSGAGTAYQQTAAPPVAASALAGNYAVSFSAGTALGSQAFSGQLISDGVSALSGTVDLNSFDTTAAPPAATPSLAATVSGTFTAGSDGRFTSTLTFTPASGQPAPKVPGLNAACYIIDPTTCLTLSLDPASPGTGILLLQNGL
jgi:hypothetical protein